MDRKVLGWEGVHWIRVAQVTFCENGNQLSGFLNGWDIS
jgi:hypothetical protein